MKKYLVHILLALLLIPAAPAAAADGVAGKGFPFGNPIPPAVTTSTVTTTSYPANSSKNGGRNASAAAPFATASATSGNPASSATAASSGVQATSATDAPQVDSAAAAFDNQPLIFPGADRRNRRGNDDRSYAMPSIWPALMAVLCVSVFFGGILLLVKKYFPGHRQLFNHPAMEVLGRTHLDQKRFVSLLRVGKRIVVIGVSPDEMRPLSEITDETEITGILELARPKTEAGLTIFQRLFQKTMAKADAAETIAMADEKAAQIDQQMSTLRERVKQIRASEKPAAKEHRTLDTVM